jgi:DNA-binding NarL/FixJ family response regulator
MHVCGECDNTREAMALVQRTSPDIAVVDITLKGSSGLEFVKDLRAQGLEMPVLILSMHDETLYAERVIRAGANGYITKQEAPAEIMAALRTVAHGEIYLSPQMTKGVLKRLNKPGGEKDGMSLLTDRELEVFQLIGTGRNGREIAAILKVGTTTVDTYRARIKEKLGITTGAALYHRAVQWQQKTDTPEAS